MQEEKIQIRVDEANAGKRLDVFLAEMLTGLSRSALQRLINLGRITLDGHAFSPSCKARAGDTMEFSPECLERRPLPENMALDIIYEDEHIIVIDKPAGMVVHPSAHDRSGTLVNGLLSHCSDEDFQEMLDEDERPGIVHRLDKDTSGLLVVAKNKNASERLKADFKEHRLSKTYLAIIAGRLEDLNGDIRLPIARNNGNKTRMCVSDAGRDAWTEYRTVAFKNGASVVKIRLHTGRTHQIRVHFSYLGHPVLGDAVYGLKPGKEPCHPPRQMLHAWKIAFRHPASDEKMQFCAPLPQDFLDTLAALGFKAP